MAPDGKGLEVRASPSANAARTLLERALKDLTKAIRPGGRR